MGIVFNWERIWVTASSPQRSPNGQLPFSGKWFIFLVIQEPCFFVFYALLRSAIYVGAEIHQYSQDEKNPDSKAINGRI